jgi:5S rRNA maturation endonuclease (ribonuclease M5)
MYKEIEDFPLDAFLEVLRSNNVQRLHQEGTGYKACCPFHDDRNPSFHVYMHSKPRWKCYGCDLHGDVVDFIRKKQGVDFKRAHEILNIEWNENRNDLKLPDHYKQKSIVQLITDIESHHKRDLQDPSNRLYKKTLDRLGKDIFFYEGISEYVKGKYNIDGEFPSFYIYIFRGNGKKETRFCHYNEEGKFIPLAPEYANKEPCPRVPYNFVKALTSNKKIILVEGEKDVETINNNFSELGYIGVSFKHTSKNKDYKFFFELLFKHKSYKNIFIIPDNDEAGRKYMDDLCEASSEYTNKFFRIKLPFIDALQKGADITDWYNYMKNFRKMDSKNIQKVFLEVSSEINGWDYKRSRIWWRFPYEMPEDIEDNKKNKKNNLPEDCWQNLYSFFDFHRCDLRFEIVSQEVIGDFGSLTGIIDAKDSQHGFSLDRLKTALGQTQEDRGRGQIFAGMKIKSEEELNRRFFSYIEERKFNDMLSCISIKPQRDIEEFKEEENFGAHYKSSFSGNEKKEYVFNHYIIPPLMKKMLQYIGFVSEDSTSRKFQELLIFKILLACPYMLENDDCMRSIRGDLRLVGDNSIGKSTFCEELFGSFVNKKWFNSCQRLDVTNRDSKKNALFTPCLILDEGNIIGKEQEIRAFYSERIFSFIDKWKTHSSRIPRRNIIISSTNKHKTSKDIESERRVWQIEVNRLPFLSKMEYEKYLVSEEDIVFWEKYGIRKEEGKDHFQFPIIEFWREMYVVYKYYESNQSIENILDLSKSELGFYKDIWMFGKYVESNEIKILTCIFDWTTPDHTYITVSERKDIFASWSFSYEKNANLLSDAFDILCRTYGYKELSNSTKDSSGKRIGSQRTLVYPRLSSGSWNIYFQYMKKNNPNMTYSESQQLESQKERLCAKNEKKEDSKPLEDILSAELYKMQFDEEGFPKKSIHE